MDLQDAYPTTCIHDKHSHTVLDRDGHVVKCGRCNLVYTCEHTQGWVPHSNGYPQNGQFVKCKICSHSILRNIPTDYFKMSDCLSGPVVDVKHWLLNNYKQKCDSQL